MEGFHVDVRHLTVVALCKQMQCTREERGKAARQARADNETISIEADVAHQAAARAQRGTPLAAAGLSKHKHNAFSHTRSKHSQEHETACEASKTRESRAHLLAAASRSGTFEACPHRWSAALHTPEAQCKNESQLSGCSRVLDSPP